MSLSDQYGSKDTPPQQSYQLSTYFEGLVAALMETTER